MYSHHVRTRRVLPPWRTTEIKGLLYKEPAEHFMYSHHGASCEHVMYSHHGVPQKLKVSSCTENLQPSKFSLSTADRKPEEGGVSGATLLLSGIAALLFDSTNLSPCLFFYLVLCSFCLVVFFPTNAPFS